MKIYLVFKH